MSEDKQILEYRKMWAQLCQRLNDLQEKRSNLEATLGDISVEIAGLEETMKYLSPLAEYEVPENFSSLGITQAARAALEIDTRKRFSAAEVRAMLAEKGFDFSGYSAPDATVRTVLNRLVDAGKATSEKEGYKVFYKYQATEEDVPF